jgi:ATP-dependent exoDNAse (exonuclease V) beta subunit
LIDGCIPSDLATGSTAEIEEERRLLYVAMTRAKDHLHLILPQRFFAHQQKGTYAKYGANRLAEGKLPLCAEMCSTKSLLAGDGEIIAQIYKERVVKRGHGSGAWGWKTAYREPIAL